MNQHCNSGKKNSSMMWLMVVCCVSPLAVLLFAGSKFSFGGYLVPILVGVCVISHIVMMLRGHGGNADTNEGDDNNAGQLKTKEKNKSNGSCH